MDHPAVELLGDLTRVSDDVVPVDLEPSGIIHRNRELVDAGDRRDQVAGPYCIGGIGQRAKRDDAVEIDVAVNPFDMGWKMAVARALIISPQQTMGLIKVGLQKERSENRR